MAFEAGKLRPSKDKVVTSVKRRMGPGSPLCVLLKDGTEQMYCGRRVQGFV